MSDECECVTCSECRGSGTVWFAFPGPPSGEYLGNHRCDDLDSMESCEECQGSGVVEVCDHCRDMEDERINDD